MSRFPVAISGSRAGPLEPQRVRSIRVDPVIVVPGIVVLLVLVSALIPAKLAPYNPETMIRSERLTGPSRHHLFGTDELGRDIFSRIIHGARVSVQVGLVAVAVAAGAGVLLGIAAGFYGGRPDMVVMRVVDMVLAFPAILFALVIITLLRPSIPSLMLAMGIVYSPRFARLARAGVLAVKQESYVEAARAVGASDAAIMIRHVLPNIAGVLLVQATITLPAAILSEASLSFLGLGVQPPTPSWGGMLSAGKGLMEIAPWVVIFPGAAIFVTTLSTNFLGDALQDWANPRLRRQRRAQRT